MKPRLTTYTLHLAGLAAPVTFCVLADLHDGPVAPLLPLLDAAAPDALLFPGDMLDSGDRYQTALDGLRELSARFPTFCSVGNHEARATCGLPDWREQIRHTGAVLLDNSTVCFRGICLGGLSSGWPDGARQSRTATPPPPDLAFLARFCAIPGCRMLLCHHPEYYDPYLRGRDTGPVLAGHAHGGQWELWGHGIFAPGQGLLPRYTAGLYDGRLLVSRGLCGTHRYFLRLGNPHEIVKLVCLPQKNGAVANGILR